MKHTHLGNCQLCGARQAVQARNGRIAKHGYDVRFGFFNGVCGGSDSAPLQQSRELLDRHVILWNERADELDARAQRLDLGQEVLDKAPVQVPNPDKGFGAPRSIVRVLSRAECEALDANGVDLSRGRYVARFDAYAQQLPHSLRRDAAGLRAHIKAQLAFAEKIFGSELYPVVQPPKQIPVVPGTTYRNGECVVLEVRAWGGGIARNLPTALVQVKGGEKYWIKQQIIRNEIKKELEL